MKNGRTKTDERGTEVEDLPIVTIVSIVVPSWGCLIKSLIYHWLKPEKWNYNGDYR